MQKTTILVASIALVYEVSCAAARPIGPRAASVEVRAYTRSTGTYVHAYERSVPTYRPPIYVPSMTTIIEQRIVTPPPIPAETPRLPQQQLRSDTEVSPPIPIEPQPVPENAILAPSMLRDGAVSPTTSPRLLNTPAFEPIMVDNAHWCDDGDLVGGFCVLHGAVDRKSPDQDAETVAR